MRAAGGVVRGGGEGDKKFARFAGRATTVLPHCRRFVDFDRGGRKRTARDRTKRLFDRTYTCTRHEWGGGQMTYIFLRDFFLFFFSLRSASKSQRFFPQIFINFFFLHLDHVDRRPRPTGNDARARLLLFV